jgi:hypothetical protein
MLTADLSKDMGYESWKEFLDSTFHIDLYKPIIIMSITVATITALFEKLIGLNPIAYIAFTVLIGLEFCTGIQASLKEGKKIESKRWQRFIIKIGAYTTILGLINTFALFMPPLVMKEFGVNIYLWMYYIVLNMLILWLFISVFENLSRLGYRETSPIFRFLAKYFDKWFKLEDE